MRPFGRALTYSLQNLRLRKDGLVTWEEEDYRSPPLAQERAAALDEFFDDLDVTRVQEGTGWKTIEMLPRLFPEFVGKDAEGEFHDDEDTQVRRQDKAFCAGNPQQSRELVI